MTTGTSFVDIHRKRLLGTTDFSTRLLDHLRTLVQESYERSYRTGVIYDSALTLTGAAADAFAIGGTSLATDGLGHLLNIASFGYQDSVKFQNTLGTDYQVGLAYTEVPDGIQINTGTGLPEYIGTQEAIGDSADPDAVTDNGGTITFQIDSVCESGVTHAGRTARVYLKTPAKNAITEALAIEELTVAYTAGENRITTAGTLGQDTVSTDPADYTVVLLGPTVKRNTTIKATDGYAYIGTITGAGAGSTPSSFDITEQEVMAGSLSQLSHITRVASNDRLKVDVKAITGESGEDQIRVTDSTGAIKFKVDEAGNVTIEGNLEVTGTTTQNDIVIVNSSETITDNLTAGDNDASDSHVIKGEWKHTNTAGTANYFTVDGDTGRVGIGALYDSTWGLNIGGTARALDLFRIENAAPTLQFRETDVAVDAGGLWRLRGAAGNFNIRENTAPAGDFSTEKTWCYFDRGGDLFVINTHPIPLTDDAFDLGRAANQWRNLYLDGVAYVDALSLSTAASEGVVTDLYPSADGTLDLGGVGREWQDAHIDGTAYVDTLSLSATAGEGCATDFNPTADGTLDLGSPGRQWANVYTVNLNVGSDINPAADLTYDLGQSANRWLTVYARNIDGGPAGSDYVQINNILKVENDACAIWLRESDTAANAGGLWRFAMSSGDWILQENTAAGADFSTNKIWLQADRSISVLFSGARFSPSTTQQFDLGGSGNEWRILYLSDNAGHGVAGHLVPTSDLGVNLGNADYRWSITYSGYLYLQQSAPRIHWIEDGVAVTAGGLWRTILDAGNWRIEENTAAGGDFTTTQKYLSTVRGATPRLYCWTHIDPDTGGQRDLGSGSREWRSLYLSDSAGHGVGGNLVPTGDTGANLGNTNYRWGTLYVSQINTIFTQPNIRFTDTDIAVDAGGLYRLICNGGDFTLQENTAAAGDFSTGKSWWITDKSANSLKLDSHVLPNGVSFDLGSSGSQWRDLWVNGTANIDILSLSDTGTEGVGTNLVPTANITHTLGNNSYKWLGYYGTWQVLFYEHNTASTALANWERYTTTITNAEMTFANFIANTGAVMADNFGGRLAFHLEDGSGSNEVAQIAWRRGGADDQCFMDFRLNNTSDSMDSVLRLQYNGYVRTMHVQPILSNTYSCGTSGARWTNGYFQGNVVIGSGDEFYLQFNGANPYIQMASTGGVDAFWYSVASDRFYFRIAGDDAVFQIDATQAKIKGNFVPNTDNTHDLGTASLEWRNLYVDGTAFIDNLSVATTSGGVASHLIPTSNISNDLGSTSIVWRDVYLQDLYLTGTSGTFARKVFYPLVVGDATGIAMALQTGGAFYIGAGEGAANVYAGLGDVTETLHLCADADMSFWTGTNAYAASDRKMFISTAGLVYIANGGAPTSGGAAKLNIGATGTAGTTDLRGSHLTAYESTGLSTTVDTRRRLFAVGGNTGNEDWLTISQYRTVGGSGWNNAAIRLSREVDNSADVGAYIQFGAGEFTIKGHWRPESTATWNLGSTSLYWDHGYIRTLYLSSDFVLESTGTDDTIFMGSGSNYMRYTSSSFAWYISSDLRLSVHSAGVNSYGYVRPVGGSYTLGQSSNRWSTIYGDKINLLSTAGNGWSSHCVPTADNVYTLGHSGYAWKEMWTHDTYTSNTGGSYTFDNFDDLELVDGYQPLTGAPTEKIERGGAIREVQPADPSTLPWPMLAPKKGADDQVFIGVGNSINFLLGAIKQLHGKHKGKVAELEAKIDALAAKLEALTA